MNSYPDELKSHALELYAEHGPAEAHRMLRDEGHTIPKGTLCSWAGRSGVHGGNPSETEAATAAFKARMELKRVVLAEECLDKAFEMLDRMDAEHIDFRGGSGEIEPHQITFPMATSRDVGRYAIAMAVLIDKSQLLSGEATERHDHTGRTDAIQRVADALGVPPDEVVDEVARRRAANREAS